MKNNLHQDQDRMSPSASPRMRAARLALVIFAALFSSSPAAPTQTRQHTPPEQRTRYQIQLAIDDENRTYTGTERVRWINRGDHATSTLFFHLYPNGRMQGYVPPAGKTPEG